MFILYDNYLKIKKKVKIKKRVLGMCFIKPKKKCIYSSNAFINASLKSFASCFTSSAASTNTSFGFSQ